MTTDPTRLLDDPAAAEALRADLAAASEAEVHGVDFTAGLAQLQSSLGAETGAIPAVGTAGGSAAGKLIAGGVAVAVVAWFVLRDPAPEPAPSHVVAASPAEEPEAPAAAAGEAPEDAAPVIDEARELPAADDEATPEEPVELEEIAPRAAEVREHSRRMHKPPSPEKMRESVLREAKLVQSARQALDTEPGRALRLTETIAKQFPRGQLVEERRAIAIQALAKLGRTEQARKQAEAFLKRYGRGPHAASVRRAAGLPEPASE
jgi:hypothetical protein